MIEQKRKVGCQEGHRRVHGRQKKYSLVLVVVYLLLNAPVEPLKLAVGLMVILPWIDQLYAKVQHLVLKDGWSPGACRLLAAASAYKARSLSDSMVAGVQNYLMVCLNTTTVFSDATSLNSLGTCHASSGVLKVGYKVQVTKVCILYDVSVHAAWNWNDSARSVSHSAFRIWHLREGRSSVLSPLWFGIPWSSLYYDHFADSSQRAVCPRLPACARLVPSASCSQMAGLPAASAFWGRVNIR